MKSLSKKKILVLQPEFDLIAPRTIRILNVFKYLVNDFDVNIIKFNHPDNQQTLDNAIFHNLNLSLLNSTLIINKFNSGKLFSPNSVLPRITSRFFRDYIYFPDIWSSTHKQILSYFSNKDFENFDFIYASILPFSNAKLAQNLKKITAFKNAKVILDIGDPLTHNAARLEKANNRKRKFETKYLNVADEIIVTNQATKDHYVNDFDINTRQVSVIPQGVDTKLFLCEKMNLDLSKKIQFCYAGIFYKKLRDPSNFFKAINKYVARPKLEILLFGSNYNKPDSAINLLPRVPQSKLVKSYQKSHLLLFFDNAFGLQLSGKIFELLATKKPIFFIYDNPESEALSLVKNMPQVIKVKNEVSEIHDALLKLPEFLKSIPNLDYDTQLFSWKERAKSFEKLLRK